MEYLFTKGTNLARPTLLLLHGTGGTERDLLGIAQMVDPEATVLSLRGDVLENGMPRFFKRTAEGIFDEEDLILRTQQLNEFLDKKALEHGFDRENIVAIGYSNGANIAASLMFHYQDALRGAILHHPMVPLRNKQLPNLSGKSVFIGAGTNDRICPATETNELHSLLENASASVEVYWEEQGHQLTLTEVQRATEWYRRIFV